MSTLNSALRNLEDALRAAASNPSSQAWEAAERAVGPVFTAARASASMASWGTTATASETLRSNVVSMRSKSGWSQQQLATAMSSTGQPGWSQSKLAEVERGRRQIKLEEIILLAAMFGVPVVELLAPSEHDGVEINETELQAEEFIELLVGRGGRVGRGGPRWAVAATVCTAAEDRPARDLWRATASSSDEEADG